MNKCSDCRWWEDDPHEAKRPPLRQCQSPAVEYQRNGEIVMAETRVLDKTFTTSESNKQLVTVGITRRVRILYVRCDRLDLNGGDDVSFKIKLDPNIDQLWDGTFMLHGGLAPLNGISTVTDGRAPIAYGLNGQGVSLTCLVPQGNSLRVTMFYVIERDLLGAFSHRLRAARSYLYRLLHADAGVS